MTKDFIDRVKHVAPSVAQLLQRDDVLGVHHNPDGEVWMRTSDTRHVRDLGGITAAQAAQVAEIIQEFARDTREMVNARFDGFHVVVTVPPVSAAPMWSITKATSQP